MTITPDWPRIAEELGPRLYRYFSGRHAAEDAADLTQETLIRLMRKHQQGDFDPSRGSLAMYAFGLARFVRLEHGRERDAPVEDRELEAESERGPEARYLEEERRRELRRAIARLPEIPQEILLLHIDRELTLENIGELLGLPINTIKSHIHRAKLVLRAELAASKGA